MFFNIFLFCFYSEILRGEGLFKKERRGGGGGGGGGAGGGGVFEGGVDTPMHTMIYREKIKMQR